MSTERELQINPIVQDSIIHNTKVRRPAAPRIVHPDLFADMRSTDTLEPLLPHILAVRRHSRYPWSGILHRLLALPATLDPYNRPRLRPQSCPGVAFGRAPRI